MQCDYFDAGVCRSCVLMGTRYAEQLAGKVSHVREVLSPVVPAGAWLEPHPNDEEGFRNKAKLVVGGRRGAPTLGILDGAGQGVDLRHCGLHEPGLAAAIPVLADLIGQVGLTPYDVAARQGELKHVLVTHSPDSELMVRLVLRSPGQLPRAHELLEQAPAPLPGLRVLSVNLQPEHKAVLEGPEEIVLTHTATLPMRVNHLRLHLRPRSFFQTSTSVAAALYRQCAAWVDEFSPASVLDLYCGVGGFALHAVAPGRRVGGVEIAEEAVASARTTAAELGLSEGEVTFETGDATAYLHEEEVPELVVVNPPRRGIGPLAETLENSAVRQVVYSSCNAASLATDLDRMPSLRVTGARLFDMFPQTRHHEVMVRLERR